MNQLIHIYRKSLKIAQSIPNGNIQSFAYRRLKKEYRVHKNSPISVEEKTKKANEIVDSLKRYSVLSQLYTK